MLHWAEVLIAMPNVPVGQVQIGFLGDCNAAVTENTAEGEDVHASHQTTLGEVITQTMG